MQRTKTPTLNNLQLPAAFRAVRQARGFSQEDFSDVSGRTYISAIERGQKKPTVEKVCELAAALGVHPLTILALSFSGLAPSATTLASLMQQVFDELKELGLTRAKD